ncbi:MAG: hypothetical protein LBP28_00490 [Coriobacteriales bacterium]|jgi:cytochrome oxidase assembly protein ShyY1|nr:hypothetical protein [Coriobacteriales bacterium]
MRESAHEPGSVLRTALTLSVSSLILLIACILLTFLHGLIPNHLVAAHAEASLQQLYTEETYPVVLWSAVDNYTNRIMVQETDNSLLLSDEAGKYYNQRKPIDNYNSFQRALYADGYDRYWHGYLTYLRPLLVFFDYAQVRIVMAFTFVALFALCLWQIRKRISLTAAVTFCMTILIMNPLAICLSTQFFSVFLVMFLALLVLMRMLAKQSENRLLLVLFLAVGGITSFIDLLTAPLITLGIPLIILILYKDKLPSPAISFGKTARGLLAFVLVWIFGYALIWASKWALSALILGKDSFAVAAMKISSWSHGSLDLSDWLSDAVHDAGLLPLTIFAGAALLVVVLALVPLLMSLLRKPRAGLKAFTTDIALFCVALMPVVWFAVITTHSVTHYWMTYRIFSISLLALILIFLRQRPRLHHRKPEVAPYRKS